MDGNLAYVSSTEGVYVYVAWGGSNFGLPGGVKVLNIESMSNIRQVSSFESDQLEARAIEKVGNTLYVGEYLDNEVRRFDVSDVRTSDRALDRVSQLVLQYQPDRTRIMTTAATHAPEYRHDRGQRLFTGYRSATSISVAIAIAEYDQLVARLVALDHVFVRLGAFQLPIDPKRERRLQQQAVVKATAEAAVLARTAGATLGAVKSMVVVPVASPFCVLCCDRCQLKCLCLKVRKRLKLGLI